jgi:hypothetical protein
MESDLLRRASAGPDVVLRPAAEMKMIAARLTAREYCFEELKD